MHFQKKKEKKQQTKKTEYKLKRIGNGKNKSGQMEHEAEQGDFSFDGCVIDRGAPYAQET